MITKNKKLLGMVITLGLAQSACADVAKKPVDAAKKNNTALVNKDVNTNISIDDVLNQANVDLSVRYVNAMEAMQTYEKGSKKADEIEKQRQQMSGEVKQYIQKITQADTELESKKSTMSTAARNAEEGKIKKMKLDLDTLIKTSEETLKLSMQEVMEELSLDVEKSVTELAQKEGYDVVVDIYTGRTLYTSPKAMITDDVVKSMNKKYASSNKPDATKKSVAKA